MRAPKMNVQRVLAPEGTFLARVIGLIYIGTVKTEWKGEAKEIFKVRIAWELPTEKHVFKEGDPEKPFVINREFSLSMGKKSNLRPVVESIIGAGLTDEEAYNFDLDEIMGLPCQVTVTHDEKESGIYANVTAVSALLKGVTCPTQVNPSKVLSFDKWDEEYFNALPEFLKNKIVSSAEYRKLKGMTVEEVNSAEIPF